MKKPFAALLAMNLNLGERTLHLVMHAIRSVLIMSAASLLFACGSGTTEVNPSVQAQLSKPLSQAGPCSNVATIAAGIYHTVGLKEDGTVVATGFNGYGQLDVSSWTNIKAIASGAYHTVGLKEDGTVVAAGFNGYGQLDVSSWTNIKAVAAGMYHTVGLKEDGTVVAVGQNSYGQLDVSSWTNIKAVAAGMYHTVGLNEDGTVVAVGQNSYGQLDVSSWTKIKAVAAGMYHTVGLKEDGTVVAVGDNSYGQLDVSSLFTNIMSVCEPVIAAFLDVASPVTIAKITGTLGKNGWYVSDVQMTLTATDNDGGLGVMGIYYSIDGTTAIVQGSSASHAIVGDGTHTVTWFAVDNAGNAEKPQEMTINIDKTPPSISSLLTDPAILWPPNHKIVNVFVGGSVSDSGSGIASTIITVTDEYGIYNSVVPGFGNAIPLESWRAGTDRDGRVYTITAVTTDQAGNQTTGTATVVVPHDACSEPHSADRRRGRHHRDQDYDKDHHDQDHHDRDHDQGHDQEHDQGHHDQARR